MPSVMGILVFVSQLLEVVAVFYFCVVMMWVLITALEMKTQQSIPDHFHPRMPTDAQLARRRRIEIGVLGLGVLAVIGGYLAVARSQDPVVRGQLVAAVWDTVLAATFVGFGASGLNLARAARFALALFFLGNGILIRWLAR
jgi:hypothetical protein